MLVDTAVIVVGAGPTGLMLAGELALGGVAVEVVERQTAPSGQSRGGGVNSRTAEVLAMRGLIDGVADQTIPRTNVGGHFAGLPVALDNGVAVTVRGPGGEYRMCGRYLVACDGGHNTGHAAP